MLACIDTSTKQTVSFAEAKEMLLAIRVRSASRIADILERTMAIMQLLTTFEEVYPEEYRSKMTGVSVTPLTLPDDEETFIDHFLHLVEKQFPLDFEWTMQNFYEGECGDLYIRIQPCGTPVSDDEIEEALSEDAGLEWSSLEMFILFINSNMTSREHWNWAKRNYGWKFPEPLSLTRSVESTDWEGFYDKLDEAGLEPFKAAFDVVTRSTENIFLDYNPYDQTAVDPCYELTFVKETVEMLTAEWAKAQLILEDHHKAIKMMDEDPAIGKTLIKLWNQVCKFKEAK